MKGKQNLGYRDRGVVAEGEVGEAEGGRLGLVDVSWKYRTDKPQGPHV